MPERARIVLLTGLLLTGTVPPSAADDADSVSPVPAYRPGRTAMLVIAGGAAAWVAGRVALSPRTRDVPPGGLDPSEISLEWDRNALDTPNPGALTPGNAFLAASLVYPTLAVLAAPDRRPEALRRLWVLQAQAVALGGAASTLVKAAASRPRPFAYVSGDRRDDPAYDVASEDAFNAFPSGHATLAWASAMSGVSYLATREPDLSPAAHFLAGAAAGGLATATSLLRVEGGKHFPSDVAGGAVLGGGLAVTLSLLHDPGSGDSAWLPSLLGVGAGTALAFLVTPPTSPWVR